MQRRDLASEPSCARAWGLLASRRPGLARALDLCASPRLGERLSAWGDPVPHGVDHPGTKDRGPHALPLNPHLIDPTWYVTRPSGETATISLGLRVALAALPSALRDSVCLVAGLSPDSGPLFVAPALERAAARQQWCHLVDMPEERPLDEVASIDVVPPRVLARALARLPAEAIHGAVLRAGVAPLGALLGHLPDRAAAGLCASLPEPLREGVWRARRRAPPEGSSRQDLARLHAGLAGADAPRLLFALGARPVASFLFHHEPVTLGQAAQKLPVPAGRILLEGHTRAVPPPSVLVDCVLGRDPERLT